MMNATTDNPQLTPSPSFLPLSLNTHFLTFIIHHSSFIILCHA